eukprot:5019335-Pleurochrysis_carterae.AAC.5
MAPKNQLLLRLRDLPLHTFLRYAILFFSASSLRVLRCILHDMHALPDSQIDPCVLPHLSIPSPCSPSHFRFAPTSLVLMIFGVIRLALLPSLFVTCHNLLSSFLQEDARRAETLKLEASLRETLSLPRHLCAERPISRACLCVGSNFDGALVQVCRDFASLCRERAAASKPADERARGGRARGQSAAAAPAYSRSPARCLCADDGGRIREIVHTGTRAVGRVTRVVS